MDVFVGFVEVFGLLRKDDLAVSSRAFKGLFFFFREPFEVFVDGAAESSFASGATGVGGTSFVFLASPSLTVGLDSGGDVAGLSDDW